MKYLIDRDKLLYELSCAVLSECSQDDYEMIESIINEQPVVCELGDAVVCNEDKDVSYTSGTMLTSLEAKWLYHHWDLYNHKDVYLCSNCNHTIKVDCKEERFPHQLGYDICPKCGAKMTGIE